MIFYWASVLVGIGFGYMFGFMHGEDKASHRIEKAITHVVVEPSPYGDVCDAMLEAAWSIQPALPPPPHD